MSRPPSATHSAAHTALPGPSSHTYTLVFPACSHTASSPVGLLVTLALHTRIELLLPAVAGGAFGEYTESKSGTTLLILQLDQ